MPKLGGDPIERDERLNDEDILLRYMPYSRCEALLLSGLYFATAATLSAEDHFEGEFADAIYAVSKEVSRHFAGKEPLVGSDSLREERDAIRKKSYVSCWTLGKYENMALWKIYGRENNAVAIRTDVGRLIAAIETGLSSNFLVKMLKKRIRLVEYVDHRDKDTDLFRRQITTRGAEILFFKNVGYQYENEVRVVLDGAEPGYGTISKVGDHCIVPVAQEFITEIVVSPLADDRFFDLVKHDAAEFGLGNAVNWSSLKFRPGHDSQGS